MQAPTKQGFNITLVRGIGGVVSVHDLHVWTISSGLVSLSCHVCKTVEVPSHDLLTALQGVLKRDFGIEHVTIQIEPEGFEEGGRV